MLRQGVFRMITVRECQYDEVKKFRELEGEYHYMGESHGAGDMIRLIFEEDGKWIALMTWAAACYRLKPRDMEIGWNRAMCAKRLKLIANNRRFTILNEKGARPNLGSQLLGMAMRELPAIWKAKWGYSPLLAETFCDIERTAGTCYRAAGWKAVGKTRGFSRVGHSRDFFIKNDSPKVLYMKGFTKDAWETIVANDLPDEYDVAAHSKADGILPCSPEQVDSLHWELCQVKDPRKRNKSVGIGTVLTLFTMGVAAGAHDLKSAHAYAMTLTDEQLKHELVSTLSSDLIRFYYGADLIGNEIGAAAKNVIGIAAGFLDGVGRTTLKGALMSRGTREIARLITALGGDGRSAYGLCHLGDYEATVFSEHSHNRRFGECFVRGESFDKLAEGYYTAADICALARRNGVELPICEAVYDILYHHAEPMQVFDRLFARSIKQEF